MGQPRIKPILQQKPNKISLTMQVIGLLLMIIVFLIGYFYRRKKASKR